jgi:uncharacterized protein (TIGR03437 family)
LARAIIATVFFLVFFGAWQQAKAAGTLAQSNQSIILTGLGANANGDGTMRVTWGACSFDGTSTNCTLSGAFTGLGPGGTYDFVVSYPGNGPSPLTATTQAPGSDLVTYSLSSGSITFTFNESNGTTLSFHSLDFQIFFVPSATTCNGNPSNCGPGAVGVTPGATETGPVTGSFDLTPVIQTVISASDYGGFPSVAPGTWIEIYGKNLATTTAGWGGLFQGNNAPTSVGGTTVTVGGKSLFIDFASPNQVNGQVPSDVATGPQQVIVTTSGGTSNPHSVTVNATQPGLLAPGAFKINNQQYAVAEFADGFFVLPPGTGGVAARRAKPGDIILLFGIGFGPVTPDNPAGVIVQDQNTINASLDISIGGVSAEVQYKGLVSPFLGLYQFNVVVPNVAASDKTPLTFTLGGTQGTQTLSLFIGN